MNRHLGWGILALVLIGFASVVRGDQSPANARVPQRVSRLQGFSESLTTITNLLDRGRGIEAENVARLLLAKVEDTLGPDTLEAAAVLDLLGRAVRRSSTVTVAEKAAMAERAVDIKEKALEPFDPDLATSLTNLAIQRTLAGNPAQGKALLDRAIAIREKAFGADDLMVAATLGSLAGVLMTLRDDEGAKSVLERVLTIRESKYGAAHIETIRTLFKIAIFYAEIADYVGARRYYDRALTAAEQTLGANHPMVLEILLREAIVLSEGLGDYAGSARLNERVVRQAEQVFGPNDPRVTTALRNLALDERDLGHYAAAKSLATRSLSIAERVYGPKHPDVAGSLHTLATVLAAQGDYGAALQAFERATHINEEILRPANPEVSRASWFIRNLFPVSDYDTDDIPLFEQAIANREAATGLAGAGAADSLTNLAAILSTVDEYKRTRPLFERALAAQQKAYGPDHPDVAAAATTLGDVVAHAGDPVAARPLYERALHILEQSLGPDHPRVAELLLRLAASPSGDGNRSMELETRALAIQEQHLGPAHPDVADTLSRLSLLELQGGAIGDAFTAAARADNIQREHIRLTARTLSERQALAYATTATPALDVILTVVTGTTDRETVSRAWNALIQSRGIVFDEMADRHRAVSATEDPTVVALTNTLAEAQQRLSAAVVRGIRNDPPDRYRRVLDEAHRDKERAERALAEQSMSVRRDQARKRAGVAELSTTLSSRDGLIGFARYTRYRAGPIDHAVSRPGAGEPAYLAFVLRGDAAPAVVPLGAAADIDGLVSQMQRQITQETLAGGRATPRGELAYRRVAEELRARIWDSLQPHLAGIARVFIVPDGALHLINFAALPASASRYLVETGPVIHYLSTERDLIEAESTTPHNGGLLAIGNPAFDEADSSPSVGQFRGGRSGCVDFRAMRFAGLPASLNEITEVVNLWSGANRETERLIGAAATERAFKTRAAGHRVLHLATHGFFIEGRCTSALDASALPRSANVARENPLLLSGLVLAGANRRDAVAPDQEDGVLTAEEVAALNLSGVEWAVLSGCDTGVGEIRAGEGVFGLRRAFQLAGARTVIMSLWPVEDQSTQQWMAALYGNRLRNLSTADAVRNASLSVLRDRRARGASTHPLYWAAFVATGDWR